MANGTLFANNKTDKMKKKNPYQLVWWRADWSMSKIRKNNIAFWEWEIKHNGLRLP